MVQTSSLNAFDLVLHSSLVAKFVLLVLVAASVFSWAVIISKSTTLKLCQKDTDLFLKAFWQGQDLDAVYSRSEQYGKSPMAHVFRAGFKELKKLTQIETIGADTLKTAGMENIDRSLTRATLSEVSMLEKQVGHLATIAAVTPFIGLFGTVWGIMNSFQGIGATGNANLAVVAPGISEALIATAAGLAAAIPAVIAYNHLTNKIRTIATDIDGFNQDFMNLIARNLMKSKN
jgi:biopolymer transport protein TolQ